MHTLVLLLCNLGVLVLSALFLRECFRENEQRAAKVAAAILIFFVFLIPVIIWSPLFALYRTLLSACSSVWHCRCSYQRGQTGRLWREQPVI